MAVKTLGQPIHTVGHETHDRKTAEGGSKRSVFRKGERIKIIPNAQWREGALVFQVVLVKPAKHFLRRMQRLVRETKDVVRNLLRIEAMLAFIQLIQRSTKKLLAPLHAFVDVVPPQ